MADERRATICRTYVSPQPWSDETEPDELLAMAALPYLAALLLTRELLPGMLERGTGRIVNNPGAEARIPPITRFRRHQP